MTRSRHVTSQDQIRLELSPDQFRLLIDAVNIAQWVVCAGDRCDDTCYCDQIDNLQQWLLRQGRMTSGLAHIETDELEDGRLDHHEFGEGNCEAWRAVEHHDDEMFWEQLVWRMAPLMAIRLVGTRDWADLDDDEREACVVECQEKVREVIERHGLASLLLTTLEPSG